MKFRIQDLPFIDAQTALHSGRNVSHSDKSRELKASCRPADGFQLLVCGHGRAGKDTVCQWLSLNTELKFNGSSSLAALPFVQQVVDAEIVDIYKHRHQYRMFLFNFLNGLRHDDVTLLPSVTNHESNIICGVRSGIEVEYCQTFCDCSIWVESDVPNDPTMEFSASDLHMPIMLKNTKGRFDLTVRQLLDFCDKFDIKVFPQTDVSFQRFGISFA